MKKLRKMIICLLLAAVTMGQLGGPTLQKAIASDYMAAPTPTLWITEIVARSEGEGQPYEFIEIYNSGSSPVQLNNYKLQYYSTSMTNPVNTWPIADTTIAAGEAKVLWLKKLNNANAQLSEFNANYGVELTAENIIEIKLTTAAQGLHDSALRKIAIADNSANVISSALINDGEADGILNRSVIYKADQTPEMLKLRNNEIPTPGSLLQEQLPDATEPGEEPEPTDPPEETPPLAPGQLLITELVPDTANYAGYDAFEFVEIYNAGPSPIDLKGYTVRSANWEKTIEDSLILQAWSAHVIWTRRGEIAPIPNEAFNSYYFNLYQSKYVTNENLTVFNHIGGLTNSGNQSVLIQDRQGNEVASASYSAANVAEGKSIVYQYPEEGSTSMRLLDALQQPTPGWLVAGQSKPKPITNAHAPQMPTGVAVSAGEGQAAITWSPNLEEDVLVYRIYSNGIQLFEVPSTQHAFTLYSLTGGQRYSLQVSAVNTSDLESPLSSAVEAVPAHVKLTQTVRTPVSKPEKYASTWAIGEAGPVIPGLAEGVVPQGLAYDEGLDWLLAVSYLDDGRPGVISIMQGSTGQQVKSLSLYDENGAPYLGHAGGIAISGDFVWIASETYLYRISLADMINAEHGGEVRFLERIIVPLNAAFATYADGVLWVGEFFEAKAYPTDPQHHIATRDGAAHYAWMAGYRLTEADEHLEPGSWDQDPDQAAVPNYVFSIREKVQGAALSADTVYLSTSYGRANDSSLYRYDNPLQESAHSTVTISGQEVPLWFLDGQSAKSSNALLQTVPMSEGIAIVNEELYVLVESGANKYRYTTAFIMDHLLKVNTKAWAEYGSEPPAENIPQVRISQYLYDAPGADDGKEYIIIQNDGSSAVDISGFKLGDGLNEGGGEGMAAFPAGTLMEPGSVIVIAQSGLIFKQTYGVMPDFELPWDGVVRPSDDPTVPDMLRTNWSTGIVQLANGGDEILLMDTDNEIVDFVPYLKDMTYRGKSYKGVKAAAAGNGNAIHRVSDTGNPEADFSAGPPVLPDKPIPIPVSTTLLITEVVYDPLFEEITGEFIELTNITDQPIDISGYYLGDEETEGQAAAEGMYNFPEGTIIQPYQALVIAKNSEGLEERYGMKADFELDESDAGVPNLIPNCAWGCGNMQLANTGDEVLLLDKNKALIDVVVYRAGMYLGIQAHPGAAGGHSLERISAVDTKNSKEDFIDQPNPTPGMLLFGPGGRPDLIPVSDLKDHVLELTAPASMLAAAPTLIDASSDALDELKEQASSYLLKVAKEGEKLLVSNRGMELESALQQLAGQRLPVLELNSSTHIPFVHQLLNEMKLQDVMFVSSDPAILKELRELNDEYRGVLKVEGEYLDREEWKEMVVHVRRSSALAAFIDHRSVTKELAAYLAARGIAAWAYGMSGENDMHRMIAAGASGLMTAFPEAARAAIEGYDSFDTMNIPSLFVAHRGMSALAPENTMDAFRLAVEMNADVIETDVLQTKEGELVLLHDFTVDRTTNGTGRVKDLTLQELKGLTANKTDKAEWKSNYDQYPDATIPALAELLAYAKDKDIVLALEMKGIGYEEELVRLIEQYDMVADVYVSSFSSEVLERIRAVNADIGLGFVLDGGAPSAGMELIQAEKLITDNVQLGAFLLSNVSLMTPQLIQYAKHRGVSVVGWTVNTKLGMQELMKLGAAGMITDYANWMNETPIHLSSVKPGGHQLKPGQSATIDELARVVSRVAGQEAFSGGIRVLSGNDEIVSLADANRLKALRPGEVTIQVYYDYKPFAKPVEGDSLLLDNNWRVYSAPIAVKIAEAAAPGYSSGTGSVAPAAERYEPTAEDIRKQGGQLELKGAQTVLSLPMETSVWLQPNGLTVRSEAWELALPAQLLSDASAKGKMELTIKPINEQAAAEWLQAETSAAFTIKSAGVQVDLLLEVVDEEGNRREISAFSEEVVLRFKLQPEMDRWQAGIYQIFEDGSLRFVGGKVSGDLLTGRTDHFSRYAVLEYKASFKDIASTHWASDVIAKLSSKHIVEGTGEMTFSPDRPITRAEFTALLVRALGLKSKQNQPPFQDTPVEKWYAKPVSAAYEAGLISGITKERFAPDEPITREQMALLLVRAYEWKKGSSTDPSAGSSLESYKDGKQISDWAVEGVEGAIRMKLLQGRGEEEFAPKAFTSRAESVQALYNLILKLDLLP